MPDGLADTSLPCLCAHDGVLCPIHDAQLCRHSGGTDDCGPMCLPFYGERYERAVTAPTESLPAPIEPPEAGVPTMNLLEG